MIRSRYVRGQVFKNPWVFTPDIFFPSQLPQLEEAIRHEDQVKKSIFLIQCRSVISSDKATYTKQVTAAGRTSDDFDVKVEGKKVTIMTTEAHDEKYKTTFFWSRDFPPNQYSVNEISASMESGLLEVTIPFIKEQEPETRTIKIQ